MRPFHQQIQCQQADFGEVRPLTSVLWQAVLVIAIAGIPTCLDAVAPTQKRVVPEPHYARIARAFARKMPAAHISRRPLDDGISARVLDLFLSGLDVDRTFFRASDVKRFKEKEHELDDMLKKGDLGFAYDVMETFKARMRDRYQYADKLLEQGFDLEKREEYHLRTGKKSDDLKWARSQKEWDEVWRKKVKDQYLRRLVSQNLSAKNDEVTKGEEGTTGVPHKLTPAEAVRRQFRQHLIMYENSDSEWVLDQYLSAFAMAYDPRSDYMSASELVNFGIQMRLSLVGIGALLSSEDGAAKVVRVIPGGPAARDGRLKPGDKIIAVAEKGKPAKSILHLPLSAAVKLIRGKKRGATVVLTVIKASDIAGDSTVEIDIQRDTVKLEEQKAQSVVREMDMPGWGKRKVAVVSLSAFYADMESRGRNATSSSKDVRRLVSQAVAQGVEGVVLDLRGNGGGLLYEAVEMTGLFIKRGPVVQVRGQGGTSVLRDRDPEILFAGPLVVLVDCLSASASEILAGALKDYGRAVIVGDSRTYGKGTVQTVSDMREWDPGWGALRVTASKFYRFPGSSTQLKGVLSDIVVPSVFDVMGIGESEMKYALPWSTNKPASIVEPATGGFLASLLFGGRTSAADYQQVVNIGPAIGALKKMSESRRQKDERHVMRRKLLANFRQRQEIEVVSLNLEERTAAAKGEQKLFDLKGLGEAGEMEGEGKGDADLVLEESLNILGDLINMAHQKKVGVPIR